MSDQPKPRPLFALRIKMPHSIDDGAVRFLAPDREQERNALAVFEDEVGRIVAEEVAARDAEAAELRRLLGLVWLDYKASNYLDLEPADRAAVRAALEGKS